MFGVTMLAEKKPFVFFVSSSEPDSPFARRMRDATCLHMRTEAPSTREAARLLLWKEFAERSAKPCAQFLAPTSPELGTGCAPNSVETLDDRSIT